MRARSLTIALALLAACSGGNRPSPPPKVTHSPSASGTRSSPSRASPARVVWGRQCGPPIPRTPGFGRRTASPREASPAPAWRACRVRPDESVQLRGDAPARALLAGLRRPLGGGARRHRHAARHGRPLQARRRDPRYGARGRRRHVSFQGALVFAVPRSETLAVTWYGSPEQALIYGWPADLGPFAGVGVSRVGDSLAGRRFV